MYHHNKPFILAALVVASVITYTANASAPQQHVNGKAFTGAELAKNAKITLTQARTIALKAHPGKITDEELEKEKGGSGLRYSFDVQDNAGTHEVGVDAKSGKVLENKLEGPDAD